MDKCYKIHGFPLGFKSKRLAAAEKQTNPVKLVVANMTLSDNTNDSIAAGMMNPLSKDQIQGVIEYFNTQLQLSKDTTNVASTSGGSITTLSGMALSTNTLFLWAHCELLEMCYLLNLGLLIVGQLIMFVMTKTNFSVYLRLLVS